MSTNPIGSEELVSAGAGRGASRYRGASRHRGPAIRNHQVARAAEEAIIAAAEARIEAEVAREAAEARSEAEVVRQAQEVATEQALIETLEADGVREREEANPEIKARVEGALREFGVRLASRLNGSYCPSALMVVLGVILKGCRHGEAKQAMLRALGLDGVSETQFHQAIGAMINDLKGPRGGPVRNATVVAVPGGMRIREPVRGTLDDIYQAVIKNGNPQDMAREINDLAHQITNGAFENICDASTISSAISFINIFYCKGSWKHKFDSANTKPDIWYGPNGPVAVDFMNATFKNAQVQLNHEINGMRFDSLFMPFDDDGRSGVLFVKPKTSVDQESLNAAVLNPEHLNTLTGCYGKKCEVSIPWLSLDLNYNLKDVLAGLGMPTSELTNIAPGVDIINQINEKVKLRIDENGAEVVVVTSMNVVPSGYRKVEKPLQFKFNRPGIILFVTKTGNGPRAVYSAMINSTNGMKIRDLSTINITGKTIERQDLGAIQQRSLGNCRQKVAGRFKNLLMSYNLFLMESDGTKLTYRSVIREVSNIGIYVTLERFVIIGADRMVRLGKDFALVRCPWNDDQPFGFSEDNCSTVFIGSKDLIQVYCCDDGSDEVESYLFERLEDNTWIAHKIPEEDQEKVAFIKEAIQRVASSKSGGAAGAGEARVGRDENYSLNPFEMTDIQAAEVEEEDSDYSDY